MMTWIILFFAQNQPEIWFFLNIKQSYLLLSNIKHNK